MVQTSILAQEKFFVLKMHGPAQGAGFKMHVRDRRSNTFFRH